MTEIRLLAVPYEVGAERLGVGRGPERLLEAGAEATLASSGAEVELDLIELREHRRDASGASEAGAGFELIELVASGAEEAIAAGAFPVLLSGSCFAGIGMLSGLGESSPAVVWFDAHGDFNTPESTIDGYFDGMPVAILTGEAWPNLIQGAGVVTVPESAVVHVGGRDFDPLEQSRLESSEIVRIPPSDIDGEEGVARVLEALHPEPSGVYLHVDLDVLDSKEAKVNIYSAPNGLTADQLEAQVRSLLGTGLIRGVSLTAYDPGVDSDGSVPPIAMRLLEAVADQLASERP
jgi:arginase